MNNKLTKKHLNDLTYEIIGAAIEVHKELGPGLLESVYHRCLYYELNLRGINFQSELIVPIEYKEMELDAQLRCDFFVENAIVVEIKAVQEVLPIHEAQLISYMKLLKVPKGILINFNVTQLFKEGQKTYVNELFRNLPEY
jgi:GxxExxY protein